MGWADLDLAERTALVRGKGDKERRVPFRFALTRQLRARQSFVGEAPCAWLFPSKFRRKMTPSGIRQIVSFGQIVQLIQ